MLSRRISLSLLVLLVVGSWACGSTGASTAIPTPGGDRLSAIPANAVKQAPEDDVYPPVLHSSEYSDPVPMPGPINTAGLEDSPFVAPDGRFYFYFAPSASAPAEKQLLDGVSGIYVATPAGSGWDNPQRVMLQDPGKVALDGCADVLVDRLWFCSAREGWSGIHWFAAGLVDGAWSDWQLADVQLPQDGQVGELHFTSDGQTLYFHSDRNAGAGGRDIWRADRSADGTWSPSANVSEINTDADEGWPYVTPDGGQLWFTRQYLGAPAIFRSLRSGDGWSEPELIVDHFAGEPTLDAQGNLYFVHHFYRDGEMIEADIYVAERLQ
jgi:hypothetical protein